MAFKLFSSQFHSLVNATNTKYISPFFPASTFSNAVKAYLFSHVHCSLPSKNKTRAHLYTSPRLYMDTVYIYRMHCSDRVERVKNEFVYKLNRLVRDIALIMVLTIAPLEP